MARPRKTPPKEYPLMPRATAVWLVENTALTFGQISDFCGLHPLEVQGIADGEVAIGVRGADPIANHQLTRAEITLGEEDSAHELHLAERRVSAPNRKTIGPRYTPISKRQDKPDAIVWLLRNHPDLKDAQIARLIGTTKNTIQAIRDRRHWNSANLRPRDPVLMELCTSENLSHEAERAKRARERAEKRAAKEAKIKGIATTSEVADKTAGDAVGESAVESVGDAAGDVMGDSVGDLAGDAVGISAGGAMESAAAIGSSAAMESSLATAAEAAFTPATTAETTPIGEDASANTPQAESPQEEQKSQAPDDASANASADSSASETTPEDDSPFAALRGFKLDS